MTPCARRPLSSSSAAMAGAVAPTDDRTRASNPNSAKHVKYLRDEYMGLPNAALEDAGVLGDIVFRLLLDLHTHLLLDLDVHIDDDGLVRRLDLDGRTAGGKADAQEEGGPTALNQPFQHTPFLAGIARRLPQQMAPIQFTSKGGTSYASPADPSSGRHGHFIAHQVG